MVLCLRPHREQIKDTDSLKDINCPKEVGLDYPDPYMSEKWLGRVGPYDAIGTLKNYDKHYVFHYRKNHPTQLFCTKNNLYLYSYLYSNTSIRISATNEDNDLPFSKEIILERYYSDAGKFEAKNALLVNLEEKKDSIQILFYDKEKDHWINYQFTKEPVDQ